MSQKDVEVPLAQTGQALTLQFAQPQILPAVPAVPFDIKPVRQIPSRGSSSPAPSLALTGVLDSGAQALAYPLPDTAEFQKMLNDPNSDPKDLHHQLTRMIGYTSLLLFQEAHAKTPNFNRAQSGSRAVEALRSLFTTLQERDKNLYKDKLDFDNPRLQAFIDSLWDLIESVMLICEFDKEAINNFFLMLQSKLPDWEEETKKRVNAIGFNAAKHGPEAERSEDAKLISAKREKTTKESSVTMPKPPTSSDNL